MEECLGSQDCRLHTMDAFFKSTHTKVDMDLMLDIVGSLERGFSLWVIDGCKPPNQ